MGAGLKYHKLCLRCIKCSKLLDSTSITDREGKIYCRACYSRDFGPKVYLYIYIIIFKETKERKYLLLLLCLIFRVMVMVEEVHS